MKLCKRSINFIILEFLSQLTEPGYVYYLGKHEIPILKFTIHKICTDPEKEKPLYYINDTLNEYNFLNTYKPKNALVKCKNGNSSYYGFPIFAPRIYNVFYINVINNIVVKYNINNKNQNKIFTIPVVGLKLKYGLCNCWHCWREICIIKKSGHGSLYKTIKMLNWAKTNLGDIDKNPHNIKKKIKTLV